MLPRRLCCRVVVVQFLTVLTQRARVTRGYDFRSRQKRLVSPARCVSRYVRRKTRRVRARARFCAPCDNRTFRNDAFPACTFRYFPRRRRATMRFAKGFYSQMNNSMELESYTRITFVTLNKYLLSLYLIDDSTESVGRLC